MRWEGGRIGGEWLRGRWEERREEEHRMGGKRRIGIGEGKKEGRREDENRRREEKREGMERKIDGIGRRKSIV